MTQRQSHSKHMQDTERTRRASDETVAADTPKRGDTYRCEKCGMEVKVTADCTCSDPDMVHLECCGQEFAHV